MTDTNAEPFILYSVADGVGTITLNRGAQLNPISHGPHSMQRAIIDTLVQADSDDSVGCVVITGSGRAFSSGGDVASGGPPATGLDWYWFLTEEDVDNERIRELRKPVIGAINGMCFGAAFMMAAHFDILIASNTARFGLIETRFGGTGAEALNYLVGPQWAKFLALSGELITAAKAKEIGLVLEVVTPEDLLSKAHDLARRIAAMPRDTMVMNRRLINTGMNLSGWKAQKEAGIAFNAATNSCFGRHTAWNGERFADLREQGWKRFKEVRDAPFTTPWLDSGSPQRPAGARHQASDPSKEHTMTQTFPAIVIDNTADGPAAALKELTLADLPDRDVLVKVSHSSLNYKDGLALSGNRSKVARTLPMVGGIDLAGTVVESRSENWKPGDAVVVNGWGMSESHWGGYTQYQRVEEGWLTRLPTAFTPQQAMAIGTAGYTAALCVDTLERWGALPTDGEVLVTGAAGGVGSVAVALLAAIGFRVTASTGRPETHAYLKTLGAENIIARDELTGEGRPLQKERWACAIDSVGSATLVNVLAQTRYGGAVAACGLAGGADLHATVLPHILRGVALLGVDSVMAPAARREAAWTRLARDLKPELLADMTQVAPMSQIINRAPDILAGKIQGRIVVDVAK